MVLQIPFCADGFWTPFFCSIVWYKPLFCGLAQPSFSLLRSVLLTFLPYLRGSPHNLSSAVVPELFSKHFGKFSVIAPVTLAPTFLKVFSGFTLPSNIRKVIQGIIIFVPALFLDSTDG